MHGEHSKLTFGECGCRLEAGNVYSMWYLHTRTFGKILLSGLSNV